MASDFLIYGSYGFVGRELVQLAVKNNLRPLLSGRNSKKLKIQSDEFDLDYRVIDLNSAKALDEALNEVPVVLHCAGPYIHTYKPVLEACLRTQTHYLDITGEIPVYEAIANKSPEATELGIMLMPGVGFDVVPTDCLAAHLKKRLPSATKLSLAFHIDGPSGFPPGTIKTLFEMLPYGVKVRQNGKLTEAPNDKYREIDFGRGKVQAQRVTWGDIFTAYFSTEIPNIEVYALFSKTISKQMDLLDKIRPIFNYSLVRELFKKVTPSGSTVEEREITKSHIWGEAVDDQGNKASSRLHGPEAGLDWTILTAFGAVEKVLDGLVIPGFQTPSLVFGPDFVLENEGVTRENLT